MENLRSQSLSFKVENIQTCFSIELKARFVILHFKMHASFFNGTFSFKHLLIHHFFLSFQKNAITLEETKWLYKAKGMLFK
jgi:hypothetical protein